MENRLHRPPAAATPIRARARRPTLAAVRKRIAEKRKQDKGWQDRDDDRLADSNFAAYAKLNLFDARTHRFGSAWNEGLHGRGHARSPCSTAAPTSGIPTC